MPHRLEPPRQHPISGFFNRLPYWLLVLMFLGITALWSVLTDDTYRIIIKATAKGLSTTILVSLTAYIFAVLLGLCTGLMRVSDNRVLREISTFYIEVVRGIPMLVILYYIAFVGAPGLIKGLNTLLDPIISRGWMDPLSIRNLTFVWRAILALMIGYSAFIAEIFRAGIESVPRGQVEAAYALGLTKGQTMRKVILPQAIRNILPALGNEFVAMIKDSALVSALGVQDITQLGKVYSASTFRFFETYNIVALLYLSMTISLSLMLRLLEKRLSAYRQRSRDRQA